MSENEMNNDEIIRRTMEKLPVETPQAGEWDVMKTRMKKEGILRSDNRKRIIYFFLSILLLGGMSSLYVMNEGEKSSPVTISAIENSVETNLVSAQNPSEINLPEEKKIVESSNNHSQSKTSLQPKTKSVASSPKRTSENSTPDNHQIKSNEKFSTPVVKASSSAKILSHPEEISSITNEPISVLDATENSLPAFNGLPVTTGEKSDSIANLETNSSGNQGYIPRRKNNHRWVSGIYYSVDRNSFAFEPKNETGHEMVDAGIPVTKNFQFTAGLTAGYKFTSKFTLRSGIFYSKKKNFSYSYRKSDPNNFAYQQFDYSFSGRYLEIPLIADVYFFQTHRSGGNWAVYFSLGAITTINLPQKNNDYFIHETFNETELHTTRISLKRKSLGLAVPIAAGLEYKINRTFSLFVEPGCEFHGTTVLQHPSYKEIPVHQYIRTLRVASGLKYNF